MDRVCRVCGKTKDESEFYVRNPETGLRRRECSDCLCERAKLRNAADGGDANARRCLVYYQENRQRLLDKYRQDRHDKMAYLEAQKRRPCTDCYTAFPSKCMDFDHVPGRGKKVADIARMASGTYSLATLQEELKKCDLVCANCHRIRTAKRGWNQWAKKGAA